MSGIIITLNITFFEKLTSIWREGHFALFV